MNRTKIAELLRLHSSKLGKEQVSIRTKFMVDPVYEDAVQQPRDLKRKKLRSPTKEGLDIEDDGEKKRL